MTAKSEKQPAANPTGNQQTGKEKAALLFWNCLFLISMLNICPVIIPQCHNLC